MQIQTNRPSVMALLLVTAVAFSVGSLIAEESGWRVPDSHVDDDGKFRNEVKSYDGVGNTATYADDRSAASSVPIGNWGGEDSLSVHNAEKLFEN